MPQAVDVRTFNKGMNKDADPRFLQPGEYIDAENIMLSNYREGRAGGVTNMPGLNRVRNSSNTNLGIFKDELNNVIYSFEYLNGSSQYIIEFDLSDNSSTTLLSTGVMPWTASTVITSCKVIEDILVWTDNASEIGMFNKNITYPTPYEAEMFTLAQLVPQKKPAVTPEIDPQYGYNNIIGKFFQFKYRFVFLTGHKSVFSPISEVAYTYDDYLSPVDVADKGTSVNSIRIAVNGTGGSEMIEKVEIAARSGNNGDFFSIATIDADSTLQAGGEQVYTFYNESLYASIALDESNQIYDDVPRTARTLDIADNRVVLGDVLTGYDKIDLDYDLEVLYDDRVDPSKQIANTSDRAPMVNATALQTWFETGGGSGFNYDALQVGDKITAIGVDLAGGFIFPFGDVTITIATGDTWTDIYNNIRAVEFWHQQAQVNLDIYETSTNTVAEYGAVTGNDSFQFWLTRGQHEKTFKAGSWYNVGFEYFDKYGRTNGVQHKEDARVYIQTLGERGLTQDDDTGAGAATINVKVRHQAPSWAAYYKIVYSRANVNEFTLQIATRGASTSGTNNVLLNIGSILEWNDERGGNLAYIWEKGDRVKVLTYDQGGTDIWKDWAQELIDAEIVGDDSTGDYSIIIPRFANLNQANSVSALNTGALIEIYRPSKELDASDSIFTEANPDYQIYLSGNYYHRGDTDQTSLSAGGEGEIEITGDAYLKNREEFPYGTSPSYEAMLFEGYDISDYRESNHYDKGRPTAVINQEKSQKVATLMYSEFIIPNTDINNLNRFYPDVNFEEYEKQFGKIMLLHNEEDHILMIQEDRASKVYINREMLYDGQGSGQLVGTQKRVLSQAVPYAGIYGIHDWRTFQAIGGRRYWLDASRGVALRLSANGVEEISRYGMRGWFAEQCASLMDSVNDKVTSVYDIQNDMYIIHFDAIGKTLVFDEKNNAWPSFVTFIGADFATHINNRSFVIESNDIYEMNDYTAKNTGTGSAQASFIEFSSNVEPGELKNYFALALDSSHALDVVITTEALDGGTDQSSSLDRAVDFVQREQEWHAAFLRDANTPDVSNPLLEGDTIKGKSANIKLTLPAAVGDDDLTMKLVKVVVSKG
jgi:hypothetical protein